MATHRFALPLLSVAAASLALVACGSDSTASSGDDRAKFREAALDFAQCMREHGVDMPDPEPGSGAIRLRNDGSMDKATVDRAQEACRKHLEKAGPPEFSEEQKQEFRERALKHASCMREHGIDMPDPTFEGAGRVQMRMPEGVDPESPRFQEAQEECAKYGPEQRRPEGGP